MVVLTPTQSRDYLQHKCVSFFTLVRYSMFPMHIFVIILLLRLCKACEQVYLLALAQPFLFTCVALVFLRSHYCCFTHYIVLKVLFSYNVLLLGICGKRCIKSAPKSHNVNLHCLIIRGSHIAGLAFIGNIYLFMVAVLPHDQVASSTH